MKNILLKTLLILILGAFAVTGRGQTYSPSNGATNVAISPILTITFNAGDELALGGGLLSIESTTSPLNAVYLDLSEPDERVSVSGNVFTIDLSGTYLYTGSTYTIHSTNGDVLYVNGNEFSFNDGDWRFSTANPTGPSRVSLSPFDDNTIVDVKSNFVITYDRNIRFNTRAQSQQALIRVYKSGVSGAIETINCYGGIATYNSGIVSISGNRLTINPNADLSYSTSYYITIQAGAVEGTDGGRSAAFTSTTGWNFTTVGPPPILSSTNPSDGSSSVDIATDLVMTFNNIRFNTTSTSHYIYVYQKDNPNPVHTVDCSNSGATTSSGTVAITNGTTLIFNPSNDFLYSTDYYVIVDNGALESTAGGIYAGFTDQGSWNFTTIAPPAPTLSSTDPADGSTTADIAADLTMTFGSNIRFNTTSTHHYINVYQTTPNTLIHTIDCVSGVAASSTGAVGISGTTLTFNPTNNFTSSTDYYVTVDNGAIESTTGGIYAGFTDPAILNFKTATPPTVSTYSPVDNVTGVAVPTSLQLTFNEPITKTGGSGYLKIYDASGEQFSFASSAGSVSVSGSTLSIANVNLSENTNYYILIDPGFVKSAASGASYAGISDNTIWNFTTVNNAPIGTFSPSNGMGDIGILPVITISYNKAIYYKGALVSNATVESIINSFSCLGQTLTPSDYEAVISSDAKLVTIYVRTELLSNKTYTLILNKLQGDAAGTVVQAVAGSTYFSTGTFRKWTGGSSSEWFSATNWNSGSGPIPSDGESVIISGAPANMPILSSTVILNNLMVGAGTELTIASSGSLTVNNTFTLEGSNSASPSFNNQGAFTLGSNGKISVQQRISGASPKGYYMGCPLSGGILKGSTRAYQHLYAPSYVWSRINSPTFNDDGEGYLFYGAVGENVNIEGTAFNTSNAVITTVRSTATSPNISNYGWHLAANPYPFGINWLTMLKMNLKNSYTIPLNETGGFATYNGDLQTGAGLITPENIIPALHAFYIQTSLSASSGSLTIAPTDYGLNNGTYLKSASVKENPVIKLAGKMGTQTDELALVFNANGAMAYLDIDSEKMLSGSKTLLEIFVNTNSGSNVVIKALPELSNLPLDISLGYAAPAKGNYLIGLSSLQNIPDAVSVVLEDKTLNVTTDLSNGDHSFSVNQKETNTSRFILHLTSKIATSISEPVSNESVLVYSRNGGVAISINKSEKYKYEIIDLNGRVIKGGLNTANAGEEDFIPISSKGVYTVRILTDVNVYAKKVLIIP